MIDWIKRNWWWVVAIGVAGYKLALQRSQPIYAVGEGYNDDALFMKLAVSITRGEWLGAYDQLTLAKGPAYSIFIAGNFFTGLPLTFTQGLLYAAACALMVWALQPALKAGWARLLAFSFLFYNPLTYEGESMSRILRQHLTVPMGLMVAAAVIALCLRRERSWWDQVGWALLGGLSLGIFWITREEGIWILPMLFMAGVGLLVAAKRTRREMWWRTVGLWTTLFAVAFVPPGVVAYKNLKHYGWFGVVDFKSAEFEDAVGALMRIEVGPNRPHVPVNREAREAAYAVSPTFAELQTWLEDSHVSARWTDKETYSYEERQYTAGWFVWALRDAIGEAGYADSPESFLGFNARLAEEINAAVDAGQLPGGTRRSGFMPRWHESYADGFKTKWGPFLDQAMRLTRFEPIVPFSQGTDDHIRPFVDMSWDNLSPSERATYFHKPDQVELHNERMATLLKLSDRTRGWIEEGFWVGFIILLVRIPELIIRRKWSWLTWLGWALFAAVVAQLSLNLIVHVMAFENFYPAVWAPAYPLMQTVVIIMLVDAVQAWILPGYSWLKQKWKTRGSAEAVAG